MSSIREPSAPEPSEIAGDATWLAQALDTEKGLVRLVKMDPDSYRAASFLDDRMFAEPKESLVVPFAQVAGAMPDEARTDARWIFHIGHVGSTLLARLLGEIDAVLSVREPRILRDLAMIPEARRAALIDPVRNLLSRTFGEDQHALVKATSFVSEIAPELVPRGERALFLYAAPKAYVASILAGENSVRELSALAPSRRQRIGGRASLPQPNNPAEAAAVAWACEMTALEGAASAMEDREIAWADFDSMLEDMGRELERVSEFFGFDTRRAREIAAGPLMRRYSKAPEYEYSPALRRDLIDEAYAANRADIDRALAMLQSASERSPLLKRALERSGEN